MACKIPEFFTQETFVDMVQSIDFYMPLTGAHGLPMAPSQVMSTFMENKKKLLRHRREKPYEPEHQL